MRIVSLLASATEMLYALGLQNHLVGISHECDYPSDALRLPRVSRPSFDPSGLTSGEIDAAVRRGMEEHGSVYEVDRALLRDLDPDLVLTQAVCEVCAVPTGSVLDAVADLARRPSVVSLDAHSIDEVLYSIGQVAEAADAPSRGIALAASLRARLDRVAEPVADQRHPRTLLLEWLDPPFIAGHWVPEMVSIAGADLIFGTPSERSIQVDWDDLHGSDPDYLLIEPCGYSLEQGRIDADASRGKLLRVAERAIGSANSWLLHSSYFSRSGPRIVDGVETLARVFHPLLFPDFPLDGRAEPWPQ